MIRRRVDWQFVYDVSEELTASVFNIVDHPIEPNTTFSQTVLKSEFRKIKRCEINKVTRRSSVIIEKLMVSQLVNEFSSIF